MRGPSGGHAGAKRRRERYTGCMGNESDPKGQDEAGPLLGWSLGTGLQRRPIDELVEFPCVFCFKAVGEASADFEAALLERVARVLGRPLQPGEHSCRQSSGGRYLSVTINVQVANGAQVYAIYEAIQEDPRVRYLL